MIIKMKIKNMEDFQKIFFTSKVGNECPYCGAKYNEIKKDCLYNIFVNEEMPDGEIWFIDKIKGIVGKIKNVNIRIIEVKTEEEENGS